MGYYSAINPMKHELIAKRSQPKTAKRERKWRMNLLGAVLLCAVLLVSAGVLRKAVRPVCLNYCESHAVKQLRREYQGEKRENRRLKSDIALYRSRSGAVAGARELGYVRPGEVPVSVEEPKPQR